MKLEPEGGDLIQRFGVLLMLIGLFLMAISIFCEVVPVLVDVVSVGTGSATDLVTIVWFILTNFGLIIVKEIYSLVTTGYWVLACASVIFLVLGVGILLIKHPVTKVE